MVSSITIWYIWKAKCLKVFQNVTERLAQIISGVWTEIVHNLRGSLDNIKGNTQRAEFQRLEFHAIHDKGIFYRQISEQVEWFYSTPKHFLSRQLELSTGGNKQMDIFHVQP